MTGFNSKQDMAADKFHWSDCAIHNAPAYPAGECNCGIDKKPLLEISYDLSVAEPAQEPVAWRWGIKKLNGGYEWRYTLNKTRPDSIPLYATPPLPAQPARERQWIWLSDADIAEVVDTTCQYTGSYEEYLIKKAERKIRSMNT
jgi:hypothetical protein